ncbi:DUF3445 domain-containing protein [Sagittula sp. NFXS13]|uniref:heme-dependent oxidative N-demethylase family protein n=1 Tax=Sagittula sp. NFXS13 TaxID=2819095 RepID=UPI0032DFC48F
MILQDTIPYDVSTLARLPGVAPFDMANWLHVDEAYAAQMAERLRLLRTSRDRVLRLDDTARPAAIEALRMVLAHLPMEFAQNVGWVRCPDGRDVALNWEDPLGTLCQIIQEDICILEKRGGAEHVLTGAVLCFPASWTLAEKYLRPLTRIHAPVASYDSALAKRVQRLFDGVQPGKPLWRHNVLRYADPTLHQPRLEADPRDGDHPEAAPFIRSERQCLLRLPDTDAVIFSIHTYVTRSQVNE